MTDILEFRFHARSGPPGSAALAGHLVSQSGPAGRITYHDVGALGARDLTSTLRSQGQDALWLNSVWDREFTLPILFARAIGKLPRIPALLSTRGEMSREALALQPQRKRAMRWLLRNTPLLENVTFHVTGPIEAQDVGRSFPGHAIFQAGNIRSLPPLPPRRVSEQTIPRLMFLGRISPVKGLDNALYALALVETPVRFDIYGPVHNEAYWDKCRALIASLPNHITVHHHGPIQNRDASEQFANADLFLNLSSSENFGHTIFESLAAGTPVLTGQKTPWNALEKQCAGFNRPSDDPVQTAAAIDAYLSLTAAEHENWRRAARALAARFVEEQTDRDLWRQWFVEAATS
ncbi:MAG: glycosyltransferase [Sphingomonadaceae bacterium]